MSDGTARSATPTLEQILERVRSGEGQTVEFKETTGTIKAAIKTLAAFGSQPQGGCVIVGVKDDGQIHRGFHLGAKTQEEVAHIIRANTISMVSAVPLAVEIFTSSDPALLVIDVPPSAWLAGPYLAYGERWHRSGATTNRVDMDYRQLAKAYQTHIYDETDPVGYRFCARCGSEHLERSQATDWQHDRVYYMVQCAECGWGDATE